MEALVVYESLYGNTRKVAEAIAAGISSTDPGALVRVLGVDEVTPHDLSGGQLVVAGGPTHALRMSTAQSRRNAPDVPAAGHAQGPGGSDMGIREWLGTMPDASNGARAAAFDTRLAFPPSGGAARAIAKGMRRHGYKIAARPHGFVVRGARGPLRDGEEQAAREWGAALAREH